LHFVELAFGVVAVSTFQLVTTEYSLPPPTDTDGSLMISTASN